MPDPAERLRERVAAALAVWPLDVDNDADAVLAAVAAHITEGRDRAEFEMSEFIAREAAHDTLNAALTALGLPSPEPGA